MIEGLTTIFTLIILVILLTKCRLFFFSIHSLLVVGAIALGIGYGMAVFITSCLGPLAMILGVGLVGCIIFALLGGS